jgi:hypothetical protein
MGGALDKYKTQAFYYEAQVKQIKADLADEQKTEARALALLHRIPAFSNFVSRNGMLAGLFNVPVDYAGSGVGGLQTVSSVQSLLQARISGLGPNGNQVAQNGINAAQAALGSLRNKLAGLGNGADMPQSFTPSTVKTLPFRRRIIYAFDMTTSKANALIPAYTDFGFSAGYRALDKLTFFAGGSYKLGWGMDLRHIRLSSQGVGIRSGLEATIKKRYFISGSAETNYLSAFTNIKELKNYSAWTMAALTGIGRTVPIKTKFFKATKVSVLYNWLHAKTLPQAAPFSVRAGYNF